MNNFPRQPRRNFRRSLVRFHWAKHLAGAPCPKNIQDKLGGMSARESGFLPATARCAGRDIQFVKGPLAPRDKVAQSNFSGITAGDLPPSFVKHCEFRSARIVVRLNQSK